MLPGVIYAASEKDARVKLQRTLRTKVQSHVASREPVSTLRCSAIFPEQPESRTRPRAELVRARHSHFSVTADKKTIVIYTAPDTLRRTCDPFFVFVFFGKRQTRSVSQLKIDKQVMVYIRSLDPWSTGNPFHRDSLAASSFPFSNFVEMKSTECVQHVLVFRRYHSFEDS